MSIHQPPSSTRDGHAWLHHQTAWHCKRLRVCHNLQSSSAECYIRDFFIERLFHSPKGRSSCAEMHVFVQTRVSISIRVCESNDTFHTVHGSAHLCLMWTALNTVAVTEECKAILARSCLMENDHQTQTSCRNYAAISGNRCCHCVHTTLAAVNLSASSTRWRQV